MRHFYKKKQRISGYRYNRVRNDNDDGEPPKSLVMDFEETGLQDWMLATPFPSNPD